MSRNVNFLHLGIELMGVRYQKSNQQRNDLRYIVWFGTTPHICSILWSELQTKWTSYVNNPKAVHLLWALRFLKGYSGWETHAAEVSKDSKTFRKWVWFYIKGIAMLAPKIVSKVFNIDKIINIYVSSIFHCVLQFCFDNRMMGDTGEQCLLTADGVDFEIRESYPFNKETSKIWYSHKFKGPGLRYEVALCIKTGDIVWFNGPFPYGVPDLNIFRGGLRIQLGPGEKVIADRGYKGDTKICTPDDWKSKAHKKAMSQLRARQETVNSRLKNWGCLSQIFRHARDKHHLVTKSILMIIQISINNGNPLFQITSYHDSALE